VVKHNSRFARHLVVDLVRVQRRLVFISQGIRFHEMSSLPDSCLESFVYARRLRKWRDALGEVLSGMEVDFT